MDKNNNLSDIDIIRLMNEKEKEKSHKLTISFTIDENLLNELNAIQGVLGYRSRGKFFEHALSEYINNLKQISKKKFNKLSQDEREQLEQKLETLPGQQSFVEE